MAYIRLEEDMRDEDDTYYHPNRKITTHRTRDYKSYARNEWEETCYF